MQQANFQSKVANSTYINGMIKVTNCVEFKPPSHVTTSLPINGLCHPRHGESFRYHNLSTGGHNSLAFCSTAVSGRSNNTELFEGNGKRHHPPTQTRFLQSSDLILPPPPHGHTSTFPNCPKSDTLGRLPSAPSQSFSTLLRPTGPLATSSLPSQQQPPVVYTCGSPATSVTYSSMCRSAEPSTWYRSYPAVVVHHHQQQQQHHDQNRHYLSQALVNDNRPPPRQPNQTLPSTHPPNRYCSHLPGSATAPTTLLEATAQSFSGREYALTQEPTSCTAPAAVHTPESLASRPVVAAAAANTFPVALSSRVGHVLPPSGLVIADSAWLQPPPGGGPPTQDPVSRIASTASLASTANATAAQPSSSSHLFRSNCEPVCSRTSGEAVVAPPQEGQLPGRVLLPHCNMRHANVLRYPKYTNRKNSGFERRLKHTGLILDAKVTLRLLRRMLQPFINRAVNKVLQHYMEEYINLAVCNIRDSLGQQAVTENDLVKVRQHIMQRVALQYFPKEEKENRIRLVRAVQQRIISNQCQHPQQRPSQSLHTGRKPRRAPLGGTSTEDHLRHRLLTGSSGASRTSTPDYPFAEEFTGTLDTPPPRTCTPWSEAASGSTTGSFHLTSPPSPQSTAQCLEVPGDSGRQRRPPPPLSIPALAEDQLRAAPGTEREGLPADSGTSPPLSSASSCCTVGLFFCDLSSLDGEVGDERAAVASTSEESGQRDPARCRLNSQSSASAACGTRRPMTALAADRIHTSVSHTTLSPWRRRRLSRSTMKRKLSNANAAGAGWSTPSWSTSVAPDAGKRPRRGVKSSPGKRATGSVRHLPAVGKSRRRRRRLSTSNATPVTDTPWESHCGVNRDQAETKTRKLDDVFESGGPDGVVGETDGHSAPVMFRLDPRTFFTLGSSANAWLGLGAARGRIYTKHPELFRYACDSEDKAWLVRQKALPSHGVKAYLMLSGQVRHLARQLSLHQQHSRGGADQGVNAGGDVETGHRPSDGDELETFTLPLWLLHKVQTAAANHPYFSQCLTSSTDDSSRATPVQFPTGSHTKATGQTQPPSLPSVPVCPATKTTAMGRNSVVCLSPNLCIGTSSRETGPSSAAPFDQRTTGCTTSSTADAVVVGAGARDVGSPAGSCTSPKPPTLLRFDLS